MNKGLAQKILCVCIIAILSPSGVMAAGKTYTPRLQTDDKPKYEICRLRKTERDETGTRCIYKRQGRGKDVVISNDNPMAPCQAQFTCKQE